MPTEKLFNIAPVTYVFALLTEKIGVSFFAKPQATAEAKVHPVP